MNEMILRKFAQQHEVLAEDFISVRPSDITPQTHEELVSFCIEHVLQEYNDSNPVEFACRTVLEDMSADLMAFRYKSFPEDTDEYGKWITVTRKSDSSFFKVSIRMTMKRDPKTGQETYPEVPVIRYGDTIFHDVPEAAYVIYCIAKNMSERNENLASDIDALKFARYFGTRGGAKE